ncbi:MAG: hypothetical protein QG670_1846 [Thermoproteota archaeon]|nr:hypothetical protein [Thermoproteota archaeon]
MMGLKEYPKVYFKLLFVGFLLVFGMGLSTSFLSLLAKELDPSGILSGFVVSAFFLARIFIELPSGIISDRIGRYRLLILGIGFVSCGAFFCGISNSIYILIIGRSIWGLGTALYFMNNTAMIMDLFVPSLRGSALGTFQAIEFIGPVLATPLGGIIIERFQGFSISPYNFIFYLAAGMSLCAFILAFFMKDAKKMGSSHGGSTISLTKTFSALKNGAIIIICVNTLSRMIIMQGINNTVLQLFLNDDIKLSIELIGFVITTRVIGHTLATVIAGHLSDKIGRKPIIIAGMLIEAIGMFIYTMVFRFELILMTALLAGFGEGMVFVCLLVFLSEVAPNEIRGGAIGLYRTFMSTGGFIGPMMFIYFFDNYSSSYCFYLAIVFLIVNTLLISTIKTKKQITLTTEKPKI